jgi:hypothetical protein
LSTDGRNRRNVNVREGKIKKKKFTGITCASRRRFRVGGGTYNSWRLTHSLLVTWEKKREKCLVLHVHVYNIIGLTSTLFFFSFFSLRQPKSILRVPVSFVTTNCYARVFRSVLPGALVRTVHLAGRRWRRRLSVPNTHARFTFIVCGT